MYFAMGGFTVAPTFERCLGVVQMLLLMAYRPHLQNHPFHSLIGQSVLMIVRMTVHREPVKAIESETTRAEVTA